MDGIYEGSGYEGSSYTTRFARRGKRGCRIFSLLSAMVSLDSFISQAPRRQVQVQVQMQMQVEVEVEVEIQRQVQRPFMAQQKTGDHERGFHGPESSLLRAIWPVS